MFMNTLLETQYCLVLEDQGMAKAQNDCQSRNRLEQEQKVHDLKYSIFLQQLEVRTPTLAERKPAGKVEALTRELELRTAALLEEKLSAWSKRTPLKWPAPL
jgi:hypothetical protein